MSINDIPSGDSDLADSFRAAKAMTNRPEITLGEVDYELKKSISAERERILAIVRDVLYRRVVGSTVISFLDEIRKAIEEKP